MLIIPVLNKTDKTRVPFVCLALILINAFVFFFLQVDDSQIREEAYGYYVDSGLNTLELRTYRNYLTDQGDNIPDVYLKHPRERNQLTVRMFADDEFQNALRKNQVIKKDNPIFLEWREKRNQFDELDQRAVIQKYGYSPQRKNYIGLFTCMFLHGGFMHLFGNMVFLWLVGVLLEKAIGHFLFLTLYIITGICASMLFGLVYPLTAGPLIGASGAIAGLMGAYGVVFSLRKIRVFYSLGFYFNYANVPALSLFPVWLGNEFFQLYTNQGSNVAYMAHIGGLLSGIIIGSFYRLFYKERINSLFHQEEEKTLLETLYESGIEKIVQLNFADARQDFLQILTIEPDNRNAIRQLFDIDKSSPNSEKFHKSCHRLLQHIKKTKQGDYLGTFEEYKKTTDKPRVTVEILDQIAHLNLNAQDYPKASIYISALLKSSPDNSKLPGFLLTLAHGLQKTNKVAQSRKCLRLLAAKYGTSQEGQKAAEYLSR